MNPKNWITKAIKYYKKYKQSVIYLAKVNAISAHYWHDEVFPNATKIIILQKGISFPGFDGQEAGFGCVLAIFDANKMGEKYEMDHDNVFSWKDSLTTEQYNGLKRRSKQHMTLK